MEGGRLTRADGTSWRPGSVTFIFMGRLLTRSRLPAMVGVAMIALLASAALGSGVAAGSTPHRARAWVITELSGVAQTGNVIGNPRAPITMQWFADLECPICRDFAVGALSGIIHKFVRAGKLKIEYRSLESATPDPAVFKEQETAALAAGRQRLMWYFVQLFFREQGEEDSGYVTPAFLHGIAQQVPGLNLARWERERSDATLVTQVQRDEAKANKEQLTGDPSFLIGRTGGPTHLLECPGTSTRCLQEASLFFEPTVERLLKGPGTGRRR
jgi:protein-disulfide isomerase